MADTKFIDTVIAKLGEIPEALALFVKIAQEYYKIQGEATAVTGEVAGPPTIDIGGPAPALETVGISTEELEALTKDAAEATVKAKALEYVKGFVAGLLIKGGF